MIVSCGLEIMTYIGLNNYH